MDRREFDGRIYGTLCGISDAYSGDVEKYKITNRNGVNADYQRYDSINKPNSQYHSLYILSDVVAAG